MPLAKPNYAFQKRQRELVKKQKKEEKRLRKTEPVSGHSEAPAAPDEITASATPHRDEGSPAPTDGDTKA